jgi:peptidoglycan/xylan/chitin deacetylase (PgdA/CDA1 family)
VIPGGNRELLARGLYWSGAASLLASLPARNVLLVLNYHRIGSPADDLFDPGVFSATAEEFDAQIAFLKRKVSLVTLDEALAFIEGRDKAMARRCRVLITFDDGYLDNYSQAFPILRSHGAQGVFFLVTSMVGSSCVPWWDRIAFVLSTARRRRFHLRYPAALEVDLDGNAMTCREVLRLFKKPENNDPERFLSELKQAADPEELPAMPRRFLNWDEAREMIAGGMAIGSHTHSHPVLSQLDPARQSEELAQSRDILKRQFGIEADALAYPVGDTNSFRERTGHLARDLGYRAAFSFYGGTNLPENTQPFDVKRVGIGDQSHARFRVQTAICKRTGNYWP